MQNFTYLFSTIHVQISDIVSPRKMRLLWRQDTYPPPVGLVSFCGKIGMVFTRIWKDSQAFRVHESARISSNCKWMLMTYVPTSGYFDVCKHPVFGQVFTKSFPSTDSTLFQVKNHLSFYATFRRVYLKSFPQVCVAVFLMGSVTP